MTGVWEPPTVLPPRWRRRAQDHHIGHGMFAAVYERRDGLLVLASFEPHDRGGRWIHVSCSFARRDPAWTDLREVKDLFIGPDRIAVQVLPGEREYVNAHTHTFHLWSCFDDPQIIPDDALPEIPR